MPIFMMVDEIQSVVLYTLKHVWTQRQLFFPFIPLQESHESVRIEG
jgi:hypothetical protein